MTSRWVGGAAQDFVHLEHNGSTGFIIGPTKLTGEITMTTPIITPRKTRWESFVGWCNSWSPQVKQTVIASIVLVLLTVGGWLLYKAKGTSNVKKVASIAVTNVSGSAFVQGEGNRVTVDNSVHFGSTNVIPGLPQVIFETLDGLPSEYSDKLHLRLHRLVVRNGSDAPIENFCSRLQLPEPIAQTIDTNTTVGTLVGWRPLTDKILVKGTGGRTEGGLWIGPTSKVTFVEQRMAFFPKYATGEKMAVSRAGDISGVWELTINTLPPSGQVSLLFLSSNAAEGTNFIEMARVPLWSIPPNPQTVPDTNELRYSFEGEYQYRAEGKPGKQHFLVPITFDANERVLSSLPTQADNGHWRTVTLVFQ
jgi:hypothetical protein